ncbi:MAG: MazG-like family protein [Candidatus Babeliales bacterium]
MDDTKMTIQQLKDRVEKLIKERDWHVFHNAKSLSMDIAVEAGELMERVMWVPEKDLEEHCKKERAGLEEELADVFIGAISFALRYNMDIADIMERKIKLTAERYPIEKAKGTYTKYTKL